MKFFECEMFRATCPATMSPKHCETSLHETFHSVTAPQQIKEEKTQNVFLKRLKHNSIGSYLSVNQILVGFEVQQGHWQSHVLVQFQKMALCNLRSVKTYTCRCLNFQQLYTWV